MRERLNSLEVPSEYEHRHARGREIGAHLGFVLDSIETLVLPTRPSTAFELLVAFFEADSLAMENCGEHHWEVQRAFEYAVAVMTEAAKSMPREKVVTAIETLLANDSYGVRGGFAKLIIRELG